MNWWFIVAPKTSNYKARSEWLESGENCRKDCRTTLGGHGISAKCRGGKGGGLFVGVWRTFKYWCRDVRTWVLYKLHKRSIGMQAVGKVQMRAGSSGRGSKESGPHRTQHDHEGPRTRNDGSPRTPTPPPSSSARRALRRPQGTWGDPEVDARGFGEDWEDFEKFVWGCCAYL